MNDIALDRVDVVRAAHDWPNNAAMIADVARLGHLDGTVLDATFGEGAFWTVFRPEGLITNDLHKPAMWSEDYRAFSPWVGQFDTVVFDPPYKLSGTPALDEFDDRYGIQHRTTRDEVLDDIVAGAVECYRVASRRLLVKCQDQVEGGQVRWQTDLITRAIEDLGGRKIDRFDLLGGGRPQPSGRRQLTAQMRPSTLLVFQRCQLDSPTLL